ncbi:MAG TPA: Na+/H+ antiporter [Anaerolineae bacterium]|nr:Na+/H+ antiporter [Anaerolineae bacterium]
MGTNLEIEFLILILLLVSTIVAVIGRRFRIPYTVGLVLAGLALSLRSPIDVDVSPRLFLSLFLPPLLFEAAFYLNFEELRRNLSTVLLLAVPGVLLTMFLVGAVVSFGGGLTLPIALVFGSLIAATDPVAVVGIFRKLGAPKRLEVLLEGESLLNDGTAIVIFNLTLAFIASGDFSLINALTDFVRIAGGGLIVGIIFGWLFASLIIRIDDHLVETTLTTVLAFGSFLVAEDLLHVSGVLAVVAAGIVSGNVGQRGMSPTTRIVVLNFWEYAAYLANSAVFLLIGLQMDLPALINSWQTILWAIGAVLVSRAVVIYLFSNLGRKIPFSWRHVLFWGGLRGGIALALAISLPLDIEPYRETIILMAFGVVLFSIVGQGYSMDRLLLRLKVLIRSDEQLEYESRQARALATRAGYEHVQKLSEDGLVSLHTWETLQPILKQRMDALTAAIQETLRDFPDLEAQELLTTRREMLRAQRGMLATLRRNGVVSERTYEELVAEVDAALESDLEVWKAHALEEKAEQNICQLLMVVVQARDLESASNALAMRGIQATRIRSMGGFLRQRNHLLLVGIPEGKLEVAVEALKRSCRSRAEYLSSPIEGAPHILPQPIEVQVRGATVFVFNVDRCEVY